MDPITLFLLGAAIFGGAAAAVTIAYLTIDYLMDWFSSRRYLLRDRDNIAATVMEILDNGRYKVVQGIFSTTREEWVESRVLESESVSADLANLHRYDGTAVYTL